MPKQKIDDINLYYESIGQGECLLFIHGLGSSSRDWELQVPFFTERYRVITVDVRGHGQSDKPAGPYNVAQFAGDIAILLQELGESSAHVIGVSMGGIIAFQLAVDYPDLVKSMVIVNSAPALIPRTLQERFAVFQRFLILRFMNTRKMGEVLAARLFIKEEQEEIRREFVARWAENDKSAYTAALRALVGWSVLDRIGEIDVPVLVVAADEDYTPVADKEAYVGMLPNARLLVIEDSRHATPVEHPELFNEIVLEFLQELEAPSPL
jgi:pimeloyl-ACP methyl ester carboxylesterase